MQLRSNLDRHFNLLSNKAIEVMTLGLVDDWEGYRTQFCKYQLGSKPPKHSHHHYCSEVDGAHLSAVPHRLSTPSHRVTCAVGREQLGAHSFSLHSPFNIQSTLSPNAL